jgi:hypothetical protein
MQDGAQLFPGSDHWRAVCGQSRLHGSGGGRRKRTRSTGTSPAAYLTMCLRLTAGMRELGIWSLVKREIGNLAAADLGQITLGHAATQTDQAPPRPG